jgi:type VI secretion system protein ImpA
MMNPVEELLAPVSGAAPCGAPRAEDAVLQKVAEAAREDDPHVSHGIWAKPLKRAQWGLVAQLCSDALAHDVKDLRLAGWLGKAWVRQRGVAGLVDGARLMAGVAAQYWDGVYPSAPGGDQEGRLDALAWFDRHMHEALGCVQLAAGASPAGRLFTLNEWALVLHHEHLGAQAADPRRKNAPADPKNLTRQHFTTAVSMTPAEFYLALLYQLRDAEEALAQLEQELALRLGEQAPRMGAIGTRIEQCYQATQELAGIGQNIELDMPETEGGDGGVPEALPRPAHGHKGPHSRDEAYRRLGEIADYLMRTEPHSPVPYLVKRAVAWGGMPLAELLQELLDSESDLKQIYRLLGTRGR